MSRFLEWYEAFNEDFVPTADFLNNIPAEEELKVKRPDLVLEDMDDSIELEYDANITIPVSLRIVDFEAAPSSAFGYDEVEKQIEGTVTCSTVYMEIYPTLDDYCTFFNTPVEELTQQDFDSLHEGNNWSDVGDAFIDFLQEKYKDEILDFAEEELEDYYSECDDDTEFDTILHLTGDYAVSDIE